MSTSNVAGIFEEIAQIRSQYDAEVGRARKTWPKSIRERVLRLADLGLRAREIAERTGVSGNTIYSWVASGKARNACQALIDGPSPSFIALPVQGLKSGTGRGHSPTDKDIPTVTVKIGNRVEVQGLTVGQVLEVLRGLGV